MKQHLQQLMQQLRDAVREAKALLREVPAGRSGTTGRVLVIGGIAAIAAGAVLLLKARRDIKGERL